MIDLIELITAQRDLQLQLGTDFERMTLDERRMFIVENVLAATDELHEALGETGWRSWASSRHLNDDAFFGELRDCWQFITNLMLVVEPDPTRLATRFADVLRKKLAINRARIDNYDGVSTKCSNCSRALDEITIIELRDDDGVYYRCPCGTSLDPSVIHALLLHD